MTDLYPVTIVADRYGGVYSRAAWVAFNTYEDSAAIRESQGDDSDASYFWSSREAKGVGRGGSPQEAYEDLVERRERQRPTP